MTNAIDEARGHAAIAGADEMPDHEPNWSELGRYGTANLAVTALQLLGWFVLLMLADRASLPLWARAGAVVLFCLMMQGVFALVHEFCHRNAHSNSRVNYLIGFVTCTLFGTAPTLMRVEHWGHHRRNRTESERPELIHPGESALAKRAQYYFAITGGIWLMSAVASLLAPWFPYPLLQSLARRYPRNTFIAGLGSFKPVEWRTLRLEGLWMAAFWAAVTMAGPWRWQTAVLCYAVFAFSWSSLQWIYHLYTPLHVIEGTYNVRTPWLLRMLFLNCNYNLTHHRHPALPWQELHLRSDLSETQPLWYRYLLMFRPPIQLPEDLSVLEKRYF